MNDRESPIFSKSYDLILWTTNHVEKFPKSERFRLAIRMEDAAFNFYEHLLRCVRLDDMHALREADLELDKLRLLFRISSARGLTSVRQYSFISRHVMELGRLLGGWMKRGSTQREG